MICKFSKLQSYVHAFCILVRWCVLMYVRIILPNVTTETGGTLLRTRFVSFCDVMPPQTGHFMVGRLELALGDVGRIWCSALQLHTLNFAASMPHQMLRLCFALHVCCSRLCNVGLPMVMRTHGSAALFACFDLCDAVNVSTSSFTCWCRECSC